MRKNKYLKSIGIKKIFIFMVITFTSTLLTSCATMSTKAKQANLRYVTHPGMVQGMEFEAGYTTSASPMYDISYVAVDACNDLAKEGWNNCVILVELISAGQIGGGYAAGRASHYQISIYR